LLVELGEACSAYQDTTIRGIKSERVQCDETWSFVGAKEKNVVPEKKAQGWGDVWTWTALDADSKLIISCCFGDRTLSAASGFVADVASRLANRVQLTTDGHRPYLAAVEDAFGGDIDYATLIKIYGADTNSEKRYSPAVCLGCKVEEVSASAGPEAHLDQLHRAPEPHDADADAPVHRADEMRSRKAGEPRGDRGPILHALHLRPGASDASRDACNGSWPRGSCLVD
jgi:IS1 family transposase